MYYKKLEKIVLPQLVNFQTDLTKHDKTGLRNYKGSFLYGYRTSGTNLMLLDGSMFYLSEDVEIQVKSKLTWIFNNTSFLYGANGDITEVTKEQVQILANKFLVDKLLPLQKEIKELNITAIAEDIVNYRTSIGKLWKSKLLESREKGTISSSNLQRLINHFDFKVLKKIKFPTPLQEIKEILCESAVKALS